MISRRGLFRLLGGAVLAPVLKPLMKWVPVEQHTTVADIRKLTAVLSGASVRPIYPGYFSAIVHPDWVDLETGEILEFPKNGKRVAS